MFTALTEFWFLSWGESSWRSALLECNLWFILLSLPKLRFECWSYLSLLPLSIEQTSRAAFVTCKCVCGRSFREMLLKTLLLGLYISPLLDSFISLPGLSIFVFSCGIDIYGKFLLIFSCLMLVDGLWPGGEFLIVIFGSFLEPYIRGTNPIYISVFSALFYLNVGLSSNMAKWSCRADCCWHKRSVLSMILSMDCLDSCCDWGSEVYLLGSLSTTPAFCAFKLTAEIPACWL